MDFCGQNCQNTVTWGVKLQLRNVESWSIQWCTTLPQPMHLLPAKEIVSQILMDTLSIDIW